MNAPISITGFGIICAIGNDASQVLESLRNGRSGIGQMKYLESKHSDLPVGEVKLSNEEMKSMLGVTAPGQVSRTSLMGAIAVRQALAHAGITDISGKRVVLISGTTVGGMDLTERYYLQMKAGKPHPDIPHGNECGKSTDEIAELAGLGGVETCTVSTACSSALNSIILGAEMIDNGEADIVIAGGSESLSKYHLNGFNTLMILDSKPCRPFDDTRTGLNLGEGAAFVVLERDSPESMAYVTGYGNRCDAFHQTASSENGEGAYLAMKDAMEMAGLKSGDIQYVNAHGTGTPNNDASESQALKRIFGGRMPEVSSTKSFTGHTTSASGSIETVICLLAMQNDFTPANLGWKNQADGLITPTSGTAGIRLDNIVCNSFGFGGNDSSIVISRNRPETESGHKGAFSSRTAACETVDSADMLAGLKEFISPMESRRMGKLMKAAHLAAFRALKDAEINCPDAIVTATSRGMLDISMQFLEDIASNDEEHLKPTLFMLSTHNTISSAIAIRTGCHGYNITYSHGDESAYWAMRDAGRLIRTGKAGSVLVVSFDEMLPVFAGNPDAEEAESVFAKALVLVRN